MNKFWNPQIRFRTENKPRKTENEKIYVFHDGTVMYREVYTASLTNLFDTGKIPFDSQQLIIPISSRSYDIQ